MDSLYVNWMKNNWDKNNMFPPPLSPQLALDILQQYLLGEDWYCTNPLSTDQINVEIVHEILYKYSKQYKKEYKYYKKHDLF